MFGASVASLGKALLPFTLKDSVDRALKRFPAYPDGLSKQRCWMMLDDAASVAGFDILNMVWSCLVPMSSLFSAFFSPGWKTCEIQRLLPPAGGITLKFLRKWVGILPSPGQHRIASGRPRVEIEAASAGRPRTDMSTGMPLKLLKSP